jgi:hypothetical protein
VAHSKGYVVLKAVKQQRVHGEFEDDEASEAPAVKPRRAVATDTKRRRG